MAEELETSELSKTEVDELSVCMEYIRQVLPDKKFLMIVYEPDNRVASGYLARCGSNMSKQEVMLCLREVAAHTQQSDLRTHPRTKKN